MNLLMDLVIVIGRIITILPLLLLVVLFMGKRAIGQLPVFDFIIIVILGAVVGADIADPSIDHLPTAFAIIILGVIQRLITNWKLKNHKVRAILTFEPTVVIYQGTILEKNLKKIRFSIDNILPMLREKDVFDLNEVELGVIEPNGELSVLKKPTGSQINQISYPVIIDGQICIETLSSLNLNQQWLEQQLTQLNISTSRKSFLLSLVMKLFH
ncbi:DUF421 domain-containing protein [Amphibacillus sediminis]|uniref:DUF421 domain-containing protein n=1 Tax=Amphibacillus sediminis TaxID=360185 RepID=UPI000A931F12|nr:DUF421 domain-containing protein [Amphibacillus sediminis]